MERCDIEKAVFVNFTRALKENNLFSDIMLNVLKCKSLGGTNRAYEIYTIKNYNELSKIVQQINNEGCFDKELMSDGEYIELVISHFIHYLINKILSPKQLAEFDNKLYHNISMKLFGKIVTNLPDIENIDILSHSNTAIRYFLDYYCQNKPEENLDSYMKWAKNKIMEIGGKYMSFHSDVDLEKFTTELTYRIRRTINQVTMFKNDD
jgi:hypothetical protein